MCAVLSVLFNTWYSLNAHVYCINLAHVGCRVSTKDRMYKVKCILYKVLDMIL